MCLTDLNDSKEYKKFFDESTVGFKEVDYSLDELNETCQFISDVMAEKNITTVAVSEKTNDLIVSVETDEDRINIFIEEFERYVRELVDAGILYTGKDVDLQGILDCINANIRADYGEDFEPFTINDLIAIKINVSQTASVYDLFKSGLALNLYGKEPINTKIENVTTKDDWKTIIECANTANTSQPTMAKIVKNQSLQIK